MTVCVRNAEKVYCLMTNAVTWLCLNGEAALILWPLWLVWKYSDMQKLLSHYLAGCLLAHQWPVISMAFLLLFCTFVHLWLYAEGPSCDACLLFCLQYSAIWCPAGDGNIVTTGCMSGAFSHWKNASGGSVPFHGSSAFTEVFCIRPWCLPHFPSLFVGILAVITCSLINVRVLFYRFCSVLCLHLLL